MGLALAPLQQPHSTLVLVKLQAWDETSTDTMSVTNLTDDTQAGPTTGRKQHWHRTTTPGTAVD